MKSLIKILDSHAGAIQAFSAALAVLVAIGALVGVKLQIDASERVQREQSARDIYREFLNISISQPELSDPDYCAIVGGTKEPAYENYVEYFLYTAEQTVAADADWEPVMIASLERHADYVCRAEDWSGYSEEVRRLVTTFKVGGCAKIKACPAADR